MTWAFKLKRYPDGLAKKFKARFCVRGDRQVEGVDYFETWAPVVQWTTVRSMMILATNQTLCSAQADITAAFVQKKTSTSTLSSQRTSFVVTQTSGFSN
jgi:hypothetical protein